MRKSFLPGAMALGLQGASANAQLPPGFVYLSDIDASIVQDIRYAGAHNFVGRPIAGYVSAECVLSEKAARALAQVQARLSRKNLSLIVWDGYRPARASAEFLRWSKDASDTRMKAEFYPRIDKRRLFELGFLSLNSAHSRGSAVDLGVVPASVRIPPPFDSRAPLTPCTAHMGERFADGTIDLGTGFDCFDELAATTHPAISAEARVNRLMLRDLMAASGFRPYRREWWHFELIDEPFPQQTFDFPIRPRRKP